MTKGRALLLYEKLCEDFAKVNQEAFADDLRCNIRSFLLNVTAAEAQPAPIPQAAPAAASAAPQGTHDADRLLGLDEAKRRVDVKAVAGAGRKQKSAAAAAPGGGGRVAADADADADADASGDADDNGSAGDDCDNQGSGGIQGDSDGKNSDDAVAGGAGEDCAAAAGSQTPTPKPSPGAKGGRNAVKNRSGGHKKK